MSAAAAPVVATTTTSGLEVQVFDVVEGGSPHLLEPLLALHESSFPEHGYVRERIVADASLPAARPGRVVHQYLLTLDGAPAGYVLGESNTLRCVAVIQFLAVESSARDHWVGGVRLPGWFIADSLRQFRSDTGTEALGVVGETPAEKVGVFRRYGWRELPCDYLEPVHGWEWQAHGLETRPVALVWLPGPGVDAAADPTLLDEHMVAPASAAFLLDLYRLDPDLDWVAALVAEEGRRQFSDAG